MSSANLMKRLELCDGVQSWVSRVKRRGLSTHPWGAPVFSVMVLKRSSCQTKGVVGTL